MSSPFFQEQITPPDEPRDTQVLAGACLRKNRESL